MTTKIAFTGAHGVGKTTLTRAVGQALQAAGTSVATTAEVPRLLCELAGDPEFFRRRRNSVWKQMLILLGQTEMEARYTTTRQQLLLCDRALLDHWAYTWVLFSDDLRATDLAPLYERIVADYCRTYRLLFYVPIEFPPTDDGTREADEDFQRAIDSYIRTFLSRHQLTHHTITGSVAERVELVRSHLTDPTGGQRP